jgi:hypothetical protein
MHDKTTIALNRRFFVVVGILVLERRAARNQKTQSLSNLKFGK